MSAITHLGTLTAPFSAYGPDIHALNADAFGFWGYAGYGSSARLFGLDLSPGIQLTGEVPLGPQGDGYVSVNYAGFAAEVSSEIVTRLSFASTQGVLDGQVIYHSDSGTVADRMVAFSQTVSGNEILFTTWPGTNAIVSFVRDPQGLMVLADSIVDPAAGPFADIAGFEAYGTNWIIATAVSADAVRSYALNGSGQMTPVGSLGAIDGLGINTPTAIAPFSIGSQPHVLVASSGSDSLTVIRLEADGSLTATDHILDSLDTRFADPSTVEIFQTAEATYAMAAGSDDGFSLFRIHGDGTLHLLGTVEDTALWTLRNIEAAVMTEISGTLHLVVASATEPGLSHFSFDISGQSPEIHGTAGNDTILGNPNDDVIFAGDGDDEITAGAGDDWIMDGSGSDTITGGAGADIFALRMDGSVDQILDFERGTDALDLSFYPLLHTMNDVTFVATSWGAQIYAKGDRTDIYASDGLPLAIGDLTVRDPFAVDRPPLVLSPGGSGHGDPNVFVGTANSDLLVGGTGDDILTGNGGDDILVGGAGADQLLGGAGYDIASYASATEPILLDLADMSLNTADALGDQMASIEAIKGSGFADDLRGSAAADHLLGGNGNDILQGREGDDQLDGEAGNDLLVGGSGADILIGGDGFDIAGYATSSGSVTADLWRPDRASGDAQGDHYFEIEGLQGTDSNDLLGGDTAANRLEGGLGDDMLQGYAGDDTLIGGPGDDVLVGGGGADLLDGGDGRDRADYSDSRTGVHVDINANNSRYGAAEGDVLLRIEDISGSQHDDMLFGDAAANTLIGGFGNDQLTGRAGDDTLSGGSGDDILNGGSDFDLLVGGPGSDTFIFDIGFDLDRIADFEPGHDTLSISTSLLGGISADAQAVISAFGSVSGSDLILDFGSDQIIIDGITDFSALAPALTFS